MMNEANIKMATDLKQDNLVPLTTILSVTLVLLAAVQFGLNQVIGTVSSLKELGLATIITAASGVLANVLPANIKHRLVFIGHKYALPGHRCHRICKNDPRIIYERLKEKWPEIFSNTTTDKDRNALWYSDIYSATKNSEEVRQSHRSFLLYRDSFSAIFIMFIASISWIMLQEFFSIPTISNWMTVVLLTEVIIFMYLARNLGNRMVCNSIVVAISKQ